MKVLIAEDEYASRLSLQKQLAASGMLTDPEFLSAENGQQAWELFLQHRPELVVTDIKMPVMDGLELVRRIYAEKSSARVIIVSGYADFKYAQEAMENGVSGYLLKPVQDKYLSDLLYKVLHHGVQAPGSTPEAQKETALQRLLLTQGADEAIPEGSMLLDVLQRYVALCVQFCAGQKEHAAEVSAGGKKLLRRYLHTSLSLTGICVDLRRDAMGVVLKAKREIPRDAILRIPSLLEKCGAAVFVGVSGACSGAAALHTAYRQAEHALCSRLLRPDAVLWYEEQKNLSYQNPLDANNRKVLRQYLHAGDEARCAAFLKSLLDDMAGNAGLSMQSVADFLTGVDLVMNECMAREGLHPHTGTRHTPEPRFVLTRYGSWTDMITDVNDRIHEVCALLSAGQGNAQKSPDELAEEIIRYIRDNYNNNVSLHELAEHVFFMNSSYLSHLLKERTGKNYTTYLNEVRMEKAREALMDGRFTVTEVAGMCGYNDTSQFIQMFKKTYGVTPKKFRGMD